jgi:hypothetical protein
MVNVQNFCCLSMGYERAIKNSYLNLRIYPLVHLPLRSILHTISPGMAERYLKD